MDASIQGDKINFSAKRGTEIRIWSGIPSYDTKPIIFSVAKYEISIYKYFGNYEGKFVVQLFDKDILIDEQVLYLQPGQARRISISGNTTNSKIDHTGMKFIPAGNFTFKESHGDAFIPYPKEDIGKTFDMTAIYMDEFPVTNLDFYRFVKSRKYNPIDTSNYLKHWQYGKPSKEIENKPVVYVSIEDARAYAAWSKNEYPQKLNGNMQHKLLR